MTAHRTLIHERVEAARRGENPTPICRMPSGWAVLGDHQFLTGYSLLLPDPVVDHLTDLDHDGRAQYLTGIARIGDALHAHTFPRYITEPDQFRPAPVWPTPPSPAPAPCSTPTPTATSNDDSPPTSPA